ncbi:Piso0_002006 [Millerozyma farinosa CBS 7064]|uniref:Piso0_002006 protein n=1 Tax=Pichia sorbitophila (strain ATCC MYA-4447 / BCRC 22081 / CBS 7064 / NBRC 10061 / NRRL Y-12695) TaxID=559304 RepID=G8YMA2_PICSO|nr:Piso0_002006 [Millerozyma farinosa CBS 7064]
MYSKSLKNLISLKRSITERLKRNLEELAENLSFPQQPSKHAPVRVPVPVRNSRGRGPLDRNFVRYFSTSAASRIQTGGFPRFNLSAGAHAKCKLKVTRLIAINMGWIRYGFANNFNNQFRCFRTHGSSFLYNNFSQRYQSHFRTKLVGMSRYNASPQGSVKGIRQSWRAFLKSGNLCDPCDEDQPERPVMCMLKSLKRPKPSSNIRLNISLTPDFTKVTLAMAKTISTLPVEDKVYFEPDVTGCYVDFYIGPRLMLPSMTYLSEETFDELISDLKSVEKKIAELKKDFASIYDLGELPIEFLQEQNIVRVHFPNCDRERLETLLLEKGVTNGTIHEERADYSKKMSSSETSSSKFSENDILSTFYDSSSDISSYSGSGVESEVLTASHSSQCPEVVQIAGLSDSNWNSNDINDATYCWT